MRYIYHPQCDGYLNVKFIVFCRPCELALMANSHGLQQTLGLKSADDAPIIDICSRNVDISVHLLLYWGLKVKKKQIAKECKKS